MRTDLDPLQEEIEFYNDHKQDWVENFEGSIVLIKHLGGGCEFDMHDNFGEAYEAGIKSYGNVPMLIRKIQQVEPIEIITRL